MCFEYDFVGGARDRRNRRQVRLVCRCREVSGWDDGDNWDDFDREQFICRCREFDND